MTKEHLEELVRSWQSRLGLDAWDVKIDWVKPAREGTNSVTWRSDDYDSATIMWDPEFPEWDPLFAEQIVVHELLHLLTRDIDRVVADLEGELHRDVYTQVDRRYEHEVEGLVDRLACRLVGFENWC
jgi:hypothetical protein